MVSSSFVGYATMICTPQRLELYYFQKKKKKALRLLKGLQTENYILG